MNGLFLGFLGGGVAGGTFALGALSTLFQQPRQSLKISLEFKFLERMFTFILSGCFLSAALNYLNPTLERSFQGGFYKDYELWSVGAGFVAGLLMLLLLVKVIKERVALEHNNHGEIENILFLMVHNFAAGLVAGSAMTIDHAGISYSLLAFIGLHQLFLGTQGARYMRSLGLEEEVSAVGALFIAFIAFISAIIGAQLALNFFTLLPVILAFGAGVYMGMPVHDLLEKLKSRSRKIKLYPGIANGMIITLIFIIWKEIV